MTEIVAGFDIGATKSRLRAETRAGEPVADRTWPSGDWRRLDRAARVERLVALLTEALPAGVLPAAVVAGAHGCDTTEDCERLRTALEARLQTPCLVVNDAGLIVPAAASGQAPESQHPESVRAKRSRQPTMPDHDTRPQNTTASHPGIGLVAGTGSIAVGQAKSGETLFAGGWGWLLGDEGGGAGLVREAARAVLRLRDTGSPTDPLTDHLLHALGIHDTAQICTRLTTGRPEQWAECAPAIFAAERAGSPTAAAVVTSAGHALANLVMTLAQRGVTATQVVAAGGVITNQPTLHQALVSALATSLPDCQVHLLTNPPVAGALHLAHTLHPR